MKTKNIVVVTLFGLVLVGIFGVTVFVVKAYRSPLGPALQVNTPTSIPATSVPATFVQANSPVVATAAPTLDPGVCGETAVWNVLVLGSDAADLRPPKGSDLTRIVRVDFPNRKVTVYAFPRDLWVDTAGLGLTDPNIESARLGVVYYEARSRSASTNVKDAMVEATTVTARMLSKNFLVSTDHYLTVDLSQIPAMVDTVGGVPVNIPAGITDPVSGMFIPAGQQTLNGTQFAVYARTMPDSDFARMQRNNLLLAALREKLLDPGVWAQIPQLYGQFNETLATDLSPEQINHLSCLLKEVPGQAIAQEQVKREWTWAGPQIGSLLWDKNAVLNQLKGLGLVP